MKHQSHRTLTNETPVTQNMATNETPVIQNTVTNETLVIQNTVTNETPVIQNTVTNETPVIQNTAKNHQKETTVINKISALTYICALSLVTQSYPVHPAFA